KGRDEYIGILHLKVLLYVDLHFGCGRSGERYDGQITQGLNHGLYPSVFWSEVMTPLRYTVRLIDGNEVDVYFLKKLYGLFFIERLRCNIQQLHVAIHTIFLESGDLTFA